MTSVMRYRAEEDGATGEPVPPKPVKLRPLDGEENPERTSNGDGTANSEEATPGAVVPRPPDRPQSAELGQSPKTRKVGATASSAQAPADSEDMSGASTADTATPVEDGSTKKAAYRVSMDASVGAGTDISGIAEGKKRAQSVQGTNWTMQAKEGSERLQERRSMVWADATGAPIQANPREMVNYLYRKAEQKWLWKQMQGRTYCLQSLEWISSDAAPEEERVCQVSCSEILDEDEDPATLASNARQISSDCKALPAVRRQSVYILQTRSDQDSSDQDLQAPIAEAAGTTAPNAADTAVLYASLKELVTAKKTDVDQVRAAIGKLPDVNAWINKVLDPGPPLVPKPLVYAITMNDFPLVSLLIENKADVIKPYDGPSMYKGWVKPGQTLVQCVVNRKGRFVGTMLADKLTKIEEALLAAIPVQSQQQEAEKKDVGATDAKEFELVEEVVEESVVTEMDGEPVRRKSVAVKVAGGCTMRHTQGHPKDVFEISEHLGDGDRSSVWLGFHRETKAPVAIKTEQKTSTAIEAWVWEEINLMRKVEHPNIAQLYETFECEKQIYMVLELCEGGRLFENCTREQCLAVMKSPKLMKQAAMAVDFLHSRNFAHRDIQLDNFLLADNAAFPEGNCKLIDFTTSKKFGPDDPLKTKICTPGYVAKEILTRKMDPYTEKVDVWSLGVVFFIMLSGAPPFAGADDMETLKKVKKGVYKFEPADRWSPVPEEAKQLVTGMINVKVEERLSATGVLAHPFLANA